MSVKYFGQFLLEKCTISAEQLLEAVRFQESKNLKFGEYALQKGYLNDEQVRKLNAEQMNTDMMIGELSVKMGLLSKSQVDEILTRQRNDHVLIGQALVQTGTLDEKQLAMELAAFKSDQSQYQSSDVPMPPGFGQSKPIAATVGLTQKLLRRVAGVDAKVGEVFLTDKEPTKAFGLVSVGISGALAMEYFLSASLDAAKLISAGVIGVAESQDDDMVVDGLREFCNIVCGNIMAKLAQEGLSIDITPPMAHDYGQQGYKVFGGRKMLHYPFASTSGDINLYIYVK